MYYVLEKVILGQIKGNNHVGLIDLWNFLPMDAKNENDLEKI